MSSGSIVAETLGVHDHEFAVKLQMQENSTVAYDTWEGMVAAAWSLLPPCVLASLRSLADAALLCSYNKAYLVGNKSRYSNFVDWDLKCSMDSLARFDAVAAAESGSNGSDTAIECSCAVYMDSVPQTTADLTEGCSGSVTVGFDAPEPVLDTADSNAAAWRTDVSCWAPLNNAKSCKQHLPFGE